MQSHFSHTWLFCEPTHCSPQTALSMGFFRQEYWSGLPYALLQGIFPTQMSSWPCVSHISCRWLLYHLCHLGNPIHDSYKASNVIHSSEAQPWACHPGLTMVLAGLFFFLMDYDCFIVLVSAVQQSESAVCIYISPTSWASLPPCSHPTHSHHLCSWFLSVSIWPVLGSDEVHMVHSDVWKR